MWAAAPDRGGHASYWGSFVATTGIGCGIMCATTLGQKLVSAKASSRAAGSGAQFLIPWQTASRRARLKRRMGGTVAAGRASHAVPAANDGAGRQRLPLLMSQG